MVEKRGRVNLIVLVVVLVLTVFSLHFVYASHIVSLTDGQSWFKPAEDVHYVFNVTISNTDIDLVTGNVTQVNITLPGTFTFINNTGTNATETASFTNTSSMLMWQNTSGLIANSTAVFFWFNASASTPGNYSINVSTKNSTSIMNTSLTVVVNDTTAPATIDFVSPTPSTRSNLSQSFLAVNITATDNGVISQILLRLYNSTHQIVNTTTSSTSPLFSNITSLSDGVYYINATVNDTYNNQNSTTSTLNITLDTTNPLADYGLVTEANNTNKSQNWVYVNVSVIEINEANITFTLYNSTSSVNITNSTAGTRTINWTGLSDGSYRYNVTVRDYASNSNSTSTRVITLDTTNPLVDYGLLTEVNNSNKSQSWVYVNVTVTETNERNITFSLYNSTSSVNITNFSAGTRTINWTGLSSGVYYYNVTAKDYAGNSNSTSTRTITLDATIPFIDFGLNTEANNTNKSQNWVYVNVSVTETNEANITFTLYNSTSSVNITNSTAGTRTINWTGLSDGNYSYNVTVRDYSSNSNTTSTRTMTLDATNPLIVFGASGNADNDSSHERAWIYVNVSVIETNEQNITFTLYDPSGSYNITNFTDGTRSINWTGLAATVYYYNATVKDYSGNSNNTITRKITLTSPSSTPATSSSGGGNSANPWNKGTFAINDKQLQEGYTKNMIAKQRLRLNIATESHYVGVKEVTGDYAKIEVTSTPQEKTLSAGEEWRVEVSNDNFYDLLVKANSIQGGAVSLTIKSINEPIPEEEPIQPPEDIEEKTPKITGEVVEGTDGGDNWSIWVLAIIVVAVLIFIFLKLRNKKR